MQFFSLIKKVETAISHHLIPSSHLYTQSPISTSSIMPKQSNGFKSYSSHAKIRVQQSLRDQHISPTTNNTNLELKKRWDHLPDKTKILWNQK